MEIDDIVRFLAPVGGKKYIIKYNIYGIITAYNHRGIPWGIKNGLPWAADLGCLIGPDYVKKIDFNKIPDWLKKMLPYKSTCLFLAGGDVVENAELTLETYAEFRHYFLDWPIAYITQNGSEDLPIPDDCSAIFIGGDTKWKCSMDAVKIIKRGQKLNKHIHIGRVNYNKRYKIFRILKGSDKFTCDGTRTRFDGTNKTLKYWSGYEKQLPLLEL